MRARSPRVALTWPDAHTNARTKVRLIVHTIVHINVPAWRVGADRDAGEVERPVAIADFCVMFDPRRMHVGSVRLKTPPIPRPLFPALPEVRPCPAQPAPLPSPNPRPCPA